MIDEDDRGAIGGMKIGRGNRNTRRNLPQSHFVHHKSHITRPGLEPRAAAVGSQRLTAWAMARPLNHRLLPRYYDDVPREIIILRK
jgi:hypothetical protein